MVERQHIEGAPRLIVVECGEVQARVRSQAGAGRRALLRVDVEVRVGILVAQREFTGLAA